MQSLVALCCLRLPLEAPRLLEEMCATNYQWPGEHSMARKVVGILEVGPIMSLLAQVSDLSN